MTKYTLIIFSNPLSTPIFGRFPVEVSIEYVKFEVETKACGKSGYGNCPNLKSGFSSTGGRLAK